MGCAQVDRSFWRSSTRYHYSHRDVVPSQPAFLPGRQWEARACRRGEADFVNVIDAQTFDSKQTFDVFGEIGGASFTDDGRGPAYIMR